MSTSSSNAVSGSTLKKSMAILLLLFCPPTVMLMWHANVHLGGSLLALGKEMLEKGPHVVLWSVWGPVFFGTSTAWTIIAVFAAVELLFMKIIPGREFRSTITPMGNVPVYKANGVVSFVLTVLLYLVLSAGLGLFSPAIIYRHFGEILGALNVTSLVFCLFLYFKGRYFPSSTDAGVSGNFIFDYYWGTELYPRIFGWDLKMFTNCRFGMMGWPLIIISFAAQQYETVGLTNTMMVAVALQLVYIAKFFIWETGYLASMDIQHDRAGFYICWGCLVWLPCVYTSHTLYLVGHPYNLPVWQALMIFIAGVIAIYINYFADRQRQKVRATGGNCLIWGKKPLLIRARYTTASGENKENLLLASGWWGVSRHFHYVPEILAAFCWSIPALFDNFLPYFYVTFLSILLIHRAIRDDRRCAQKYGEDWDAYRKVVSYRIIPGIF